MNKLIKRNEAQVLRALLKVQNTRIGFTSGAFDLLHIGHINFLERAKEIAGYLIVGLNSDASIKESKGMNRPIISQEHRAKMLSALSCVDAIFIFDEKNNHENIRILTPDFYIKGNDYQNNKPLTSRSLVEAYGGKVIVIDTLPEPTTSSIINKIKSL